MSPMRTAKVPQSLTQGAVFGRNWGPSGWLTLLLFPRHGRLMATPENRSENSLAGERFALMKTETPRRKHNPSRGT
jgi:hypothetical protein